MNNFLVCLGVLSGISETKKGKSEIYFGFEDCRASVVALSLGVFRPFALFPTLLVVRCV